MNPDALSGVTEAGGNGVERVGNVAPVTEVAATPFAPDTAGAESLLAALSGGGSETAYADEIMGDVNPEEIMSNMDKILGDENPKVSGIESPNRAIIETKIASTPISTQASEGMANATEAETKAASTTDPALSTNTAASESEQLAAALAAGAGSETAYADEIMGRDKNGKESTQDQEDTYRKGIRKSPQITTPQDAINRPRVGGQPGEIPKVVPPSTDTAIPPVEAGAAPVGRDKVDKPVDLPVSEPIDGDAGSPTIEAPKEPSADMTEDGLDTGTPTAAPPAESSEPESTRDQLSSRIEALEARIEALEAEQNPTHEQKNELTQARLELAQRDRWDMLNAANPSTLKPDEITERDELNTKFGEPIPVSPGSPKESRDLGEFNEEAVRQAIENDRNRKDWTQDQKDAYVNGKRAEHDKKAGYDESLKQKETEQELTIEQQKQKLDQELAQVQEDLVEGKMTAQDALQKLVNNRHARDILLRSVLEKHQKGKELTPYEKEVAEKTLQMQQLMREVQMAPKVMKAMERTIKGLKDEYKKAAQFRINEQNAADPKTQENVALRAKLSNQIAAQAAHIAKYAGITSVNVNEFKSVNSDLMKLIGVRSSFNNILVQIGTDIVRKANTYRKDIDARRIVHRA